MLPIVIANPKQLTIVNADPFLSGGVEIATNEENCGESATGNTGECMIQNQERYANFHAS